MFGFPTIWKPVSQEYEHLEPTKVPLEHETCRPGYFLIVKFGSHLMPGFEQVGPHGPSQ